MLPCYISLELHHQAQAPWLICGVRGWNFRRLRHCALHALSVARELTMWNDGPLLPSVFSHSAFCAEK